MDNILKIYKTLGDKKNKIKLFVFLILISAILEILGVAMVVPVLTLILSSSEIIIINFEFFSLQNLKFDKENLLIGTVIFIFFFYLLKSIFLGYFNYWRSKFIFSLNEIISGKLFNIYLYQPYKFHISRNSSTSTRNLIAIQNYVRNIDQCAHLITELIILFSFLIVLFLYEPMITIYMSVVALIFGTIYIKIVNPINFRVGQDSHKSTQSIIQNINQGLFGIKDIKLYGREKDFLKSFNLNIRKFSKSLTIFEFLQPLPRILLEFLAVILIIITVTALYYLKYENNEIIIFVALLAAVGFKLIPSLNKVLFAIQHLKYYLPLSENIYQELNLKITKTALNNKKIQFNNEIELKNLNFSYGDKLILKNVDLKIRKNSSIGIIGKTGSGKTTLINILLGLLDVDNGKVTIDGYICNFNNRSWQDRIGYVPQNIYIVDDTIKKNIAFGISDDQIDDKKILRSLQIAQMDNFIHKLSNGVSTMVGENGTQLSGGQIQRLGIARAVYNDPEILIFDEPSSSLDQETEDRFIEAIEKLKIDKTIIIISHRESALSFCDEVYKLDEAQLSNIRNDKNI